MTIDIFLEGTMDCSDITVIRFHGREAISELFHFEVDVSVLTGDALPDELEPGTEIAVVMVGPERDERRFHGIVERITTERVPSLPHPLFKLVIVPRAARALLIQQQQILMKLDVQALIHDRLALVDLAGTDIDVSGLSGYPVHEFIVQYGETDWDLICRYVEHYGICFWFDHQFGSDRITFGDTVDDFAINDGAPELHFPTRDDEPGTLIWLQEDSSVVPNHFAVYDYNYRNPDLTLFADTDIDGSGGAVLEYGTHLKTQAEAEMFAAIRAQERACRKRYYRGKSTVHQLRPGTRSTVMEQGRLPELALVIEAVEHHAEFARFQASGEENSYSNTFTAVTTEHPYRPLRRTPKPRIHGFVTGTIQGASDSAVSPLLDGEGRYLVAFHFDVAGERAAASRPCRMMQPFGGTTHGMHFPLRPGTEVAVAFAGGDPDRPVIMGALDNPLAPSPVNANNATLNRVTTQSGAVFEIGESQ